MPSTSIPLKSIPRIDFFTLQIHQRLQHGFRHSTQKIALIMLLQQLDQGHASPSASNQWRLHGSISVIGDLLGLWLTFATPP